MLRLTLSIFFLSISCLTVITFKQRLLLASISRPRPCPFRQAGHQAATKTAKKVAKKAAKSGIKSSKAGDSSPRDDDQRGADKPGHSRKGSRSVGFGFL